LVASVGRAGIAASSRTCVSRDQPADICLLLLVQDKQDKLLAQLVRLILGLLC
jgi:hypothetical protein